jgi:hypothetical protein
MAQDVIFDTTTFKHMKRQNFIIVSIFTGLVTLTSCGNSNTETKSNAESETISIDKTKTEKVNLIIDIKSINGKTLSEVEKVLGKAESTEKVKGYPCKNSNCQRAFFKNGDIEIIFKLNKADRITINSVPNLTDNENALEALGLTTSTPSFKNANNVIRWQEKDNINEISFFTDYILIQVTKPE